MECNHDAAPALDSLLFLTDPLPKSADNFDGKYAFLCQKQVYGKEEEEKCGRRIWSLPYVGRKKCQRCRGRETNGIWEHKEFIREINGPPRDSAYSRAWRCSAQQATVPIQPSEPVGRVQPIARRKKWNSTVVNEILVKQDRKCNVCRKLLVVLLYQMDHTHALADGGPDHPGNLQALCLECHTKKTQREEVARRLAEDEERRGGGGAGDDTDE